MKSINTAGKGTRGPRRQIADDRESLATRKRRERRAVADDAESLAMSIEAFCRRHGISVSKYFELPEFERPAILRIGRRKLITTEAAAEWRARLSGKGAA